MGGRGRIATLAALTAALAPAAPAAAQVPVVPQITASPASPGNATHVTWTFEGSALTQCRLVEPDPDEEVWSLCPPGDHSHDLTAGDGIYAFEVSSTGLSADDSSEYVLDTSAPAAPEITGGPSGTTGDSSPTFSFDAAGAAAECRLDRGGVVHDWSGCTSPWSYGLATEPDGAYEFLVRVRDAAGNTSPAASRPFTLDRSVLPGPTIPTGSVPPVPGSVPPVPVALRPGVCINLFTGTDASDTLNGSMFGDVVLGAAGNDRIDGRGGDDCLLGNAGADRLFGSTGDDDVRGLGGNDVLEGGSGNDRIAGGGGYDRAAGNAGDDTVVGGTGRDSLKGGAGRDVLTGAAGRDTVSGGAGDDTIDSRDGTVDRVRCGAGTDSVKTDAMDRVAGCERRG